MSWHQTHWSLLKEILLGSVSLWVWCGTLPADFHMDHSQDSSERVSSSTQVRPICQNHQICEFSMCAGGSDFSHPSSSSVYIYPTLWLWIQFPSLSQATFSLHVCEQAHDPMQTWAGLVHRVVSTDCALSALLIVHTHLDQKWSDPMVYYVWMTQTFAHHLQLRGQVWEMWSISD